jgi:hypothetical protein
MHIVTREGQGDPVVPNRRQLPREQYALLSRTDFMAQYRVSKTQFFRLVKSGALPVRRLGRAIRIRPEDAEAWAAGLPVGKAA